MIFNLCARYLVIWLNETVYMGAQGQTVVWKSHREETTKWPERRVHPESVTHVSVVFPYHSWSSLASSVCQSGERERQGQIEQSRRSVTWTRMGGWDHRGEQVPQSGDEWMAFGEQSLCSGPRSKNETRFPSSCGNVQHWTARR